MKITKKEIREAAEQIEWVDDAPDQLFAQIKANRDKKANKTPTITMAQMRQNFTNAKAGGMTLPTYYVTINGDSGLITDVGVQTSIWAATRYVVIFNGQLRFYDSEVKVVVHSTT